MILSNGKVVTWKDMSSKIYVDNNGNKLWGGTDWVLSVT